MSTRRVLVLIFAAVFFAILIQPCSAQTGDSDITRVLDQSGYQYSKSDDGRWEMQISGKAISFLLVDDMVMVMYTFADRTAFANTAAANEKLVELNHLFDNTKFCFSKKWLYVRIDQRRRHFDVQELKDMVTQLVNVVDETSPEIKPFITN